MQLNYHECVIKLIKNWEKMINDSFKMRGAMKNYENTRRAGICLRDAQDRVIHKNDLSPDTQLKFSNEMCNIIESVRISRLKLFTIISYNAKHPQTPY